MDNIFTKTMAAIICTGFIASSVSAGDVRTATIINKDKKRVFTVVLGEGSSDCNDADYAVDIPSAKKRANSLSIGEIDGVAASLGKGVCGKLGNKFFIIPGQKIEVPAGAAGSVSYDATRTYELYLKENPVMANDRSIKGKAKLTLKKADIFRSNLTWGSCNVTGAGKKTQVYKKSLGRSASCKKG